MLHPVAQALSPRAADHEVVRVRPGRSQPGPFRNRWRSRWRGSNATGTCRRPRMAASPLPP